MHRAVKWKLLLPLAVLAVTAFCGATQASPCAPYPNNLTNGTTADATQVMADFNSILNCANSSLTPNASPTITGITTIVSSGLAVLADNAVSTSYTGFRVYNDQRSAFRALEIDYAGSAYADALENGGVVGEAAAVTATGAYPLMLGTNNTMRITILGGGNVGVATPTPYDAFVVAGLRSVAISPSNAEGVGYGVNITGDSGGWATGYTFTGSSAAALGGFGAVGSANTLTRFFIGTYSTGEKLSIQSNGNVGVGTTAPSSN